jgi:hypothetical protein
MTAVGIAHQGSLGKLHVSGKNRQKSRAPGQLAADLRDLRIETLLIPAINKELIDQGARKLTRSYRDIAKFIARLGQIETALTLEEALGMSSRTAERAFLELRKTSYFIYVPGRKSRVKAYRLRAEISLTPEAADWVSYQTVYSVVQRCGGRIRESAKAVLGVGWGQGPQATNSRTSGEPTRQAVGSQEISAGGCRRRASKQSLAVAQATASGEEFMMKAWEALKAEGAEPHAQSQLLATSLPAEDVNAIVLEALQAAKARQKRNPVGYALKAIACPEMGNRLLKRARERHALPMVPQVASGELLEAAREAVALVSGLDLAEALDTLLRRAKSLEGFGLISVVRATAKKVGSTKGKGGSPARLFGWLVTKGPRDLAREAEREDRRRQQEVKSSPAFDMAWEAVREPLRSDPKAKSAFATWKGHQVDAPLPDAPGFLEHFDRDRELFRKLLALAEAHLGNRVESLEAALRARLLALKLHEGTLPWKRAWEHHWAVAMCEAWAIPT